MVCAMSVESPASASSPPAIGLADVLIALGVAAIGQQEAWFPVQGLNTRVGPPWTLAVTYLVVSIALVWRRRAPLTVVVFVNGALALDFLAVGPSEGLGPFVPVVIAAYALGRHGSAAEFLPGMIVIVAGIVVHEARATESLPPGPTIVFWTIMVGAGVVGRAFAGKARSLEEADDRRRRSEIEHEERHRMAAADERRRITRELHDLVGHGLALMVVQAGAAQATLEACDGPGVGRRLEQLEVTARGTLAEMRRLLAVTTPADPHPERQPQPGLQDIPTLVEQVRATGLPVEYAGPPESSGVSAGLGLAAYRLVQEALTNVVKHAGAGTETQVEVRLDAGSIAIDVTDDGRRGIPPAADGRGLIGMRERVALYGGTFDAGPRAKGGFAVHARLPLDVSAS